MTADDTGIADRDAEHAGGDTRKCPYCAETIKAEAVICRYCHSRLDGASDSGGTPADAQPGTGKAPRSPLNRVVRLVAGLAAVGVMLYFALAVTGLTCGMTIPLMGQVKCAKPATTDRTAWIKQQTKIIVAKNTFQKQVALCVTAANAVESPSPRGFSKCVQDGSGELESLAPGQKSNTQRMVDYLKAGECRTALVKWRGAFDEMMAFVTDMDIGKVTITSTGELGQHIRDYWKAVDTREAKLGATVVDACDR